MAKKKVSFVSGPGTLFPKDWLMAQGTSQSQKPPLIVQAVLRYEEDVRREPLQLKVVLRNLDDLRQRYNPSATRWRTLIGTIERVIREDIEERFVLENDPKGANWADLAPSTKGSGNRGREILTKTGKLRRSFDVKIVGDSIYVWTNTKYAKFHQFGAVRRRSDEKETYEAKHKRGIKEIAKSGRSLVFSMPPRPFLGLSKVAANVILQLMREFEEESLVIRTKRGLESKYGFEQ